MRRFKLVIFVDVNIKQLAGAFTTQDVEILLSTMNRTSLDFLEPMFPFAHFATFNILIVNQTVPGQELESGYATVRVLNAYEKGLSKSRNLLLDNASKKIGLLADDDLVYIEGFNCKVAQGFNRFPGAAAVKFNTISFEGQLFRKYPEKPVSRLGALQRLNSTSWEIALNVAVLRQSGTRFDTRFGLGAAFPLGEEPVLLNALHHAGYNIAHEPEVTVSHKPLKDSDNIPLAESYRIRGAYLSKIFGSSFLLWLGIQLAYNLKSGEVKPWQLPFCIKNALKGKKQLSLLHENQP
jgi:hypothetical protein